MLLKLVAQRIKKALSLMFVRVWNTSSNVKEKVDKQRKNLLRYLLQPFQGIN